MATCHNCGKPLHDKFCTFCGAPARQASSRAVNNGGICACWAMLCGGGTGARQPDDAYVELNDDSNHRYRQTKTSLIGQAAEEHLIPPADLHIDLADELGKGASAKVYRGRYQEQEVAVKVMGGDEYDEEFKHELRIIIRLQHPNILK